MFTYWPFISLVVMGVMITILLLLKFSDKICRVRMTAGGGFVENKYQDDQVNIWLTLHWPRNFLKLSNKCQWCHCNFNAIVIECVTN